VLCVQQREEKWFAVSNDETGVVLTREDYCVAESNVLTTAEGNAR
jgi:hypothetical protein